MRIRVRFTKNECIKYLGHLDIMRAFQKCLNRAGIKVAYSEGFNPHQKISFALPLGVGITSEAEYMDAEIIDGQDICMIKNALNEVSGPGFDIINVRILKDNAAKAMAAVEYADFLIKNIDEKISDDDITSFLAQDEIIAEKKTKKGMKEEDIRPLIYEMKKDGRTLSLKLKAGSIGNLKPDTLIRSLYDFLMFSYDDNDIRIIRKELSGRDFIPLDELDVEK